MVTMLEQILAEAASIRDLARRLGSECLDSEGEIARLRRELPSSEAIGARLESDVIAMARDLWEPRFEGAGSLEHLTAALREETVVVRETAPELASWRFLRGMCRSVLRRWFEAVQEPVHLERGDPYPLPSRPTHKAVIDPTPYPPNSDRGQLLGRTQFRLYRAPAAHLSVILDFSERDDIDEATWIGNTDAGRFPLIATVHPYRHADDLTVEDVNDEWFFGVRPRVWDAGDVLRLIREAKALSAAIALLPELSLPASNALAAAVAEEPDSYPPLLVCGSAHIREPATTGGRPAVRANECCVYLNGRPLLRHRKVHPFEARYLGPNVPRLDEALPEGLTEEPKVLTVASGSMTRLAIVICADLNDVEIPTILTQLGVNAMLVPALTEHEGAFIGAIADVASRMQGYSVIANGTPIVDPDEPANRAPFMVLAGVPRVEAAQQLRTYQAPSSGRRAIGLLDLNADADDSMVWHNP